jgi:TonB family protein
MKRWIVLVLIFCFSFPLMAQSPKEWEQELRSTLKNKFLSLKHFYLEDNQDYDANGNMTKDDELGSWYMYSTFRLEVLKLTDHSMHIEGRRVYLGFQKNGDKDLSYVTQNNLVLDIAVLGPIDKSAYIKALNRITMSSVGGYESLVANLKNRQDADSIEYREKQKLATSTPGNAGIEQNITGPIRIGEIKLGQAIIAPKPIYPQDARQNHLNGTVVFAATISTKGKIKNLRLVKSAYPSLDESAFDSVSRWVYKPYMLNSKPVEVETSITVKFQMVGP